MSKNKKRKKGAKEGEVTHFQGIRWFTGGGQDIILASIFAASFKFRQQLVYYPVS